MQTERILVPLDLPKCHPDVFSRINLFASRAKLTVILLHVIRLNRSAGDNRAYDSLVREARWHLEHLARQFLHPNATSILRVRVGKPAEEILAEAKAEAADLIVLPLSNDANRDGRPRLVNRLFGALATGISQRVIRLAPCPILVLRATTQFDCRQHSATQAKNVRSALEYLEVISGKDTPAELEPEDPLAQDLSGPDVPSRLPQTADRLRSHLRVAA